MNNRLINTKVAGGGGCTDIVDNYDPFGGNGVALYQLNGNANDVSGNYNGTATSVTYGTGVFGQAGVFNGSSSKISATGMSLTEANISLWLKLDTLSKEHFIFSFDYSATNSFIFLYEPNTFNTLRTIDLAADPNAVSLLPSNTIQVDTWYHISLNITSTQITLYLNGVAQTPVSSNRGNTPFPMPFELGYATTRNKTESYLNGSIDQVRVFNTALDPLEVEALYTEELCICDGTVDTLDILGDGSCIATYQLDGNANDLSGNYSGTPTDVSYGVGEFDLAGVFNGSSSYVNIDSLLFPVNNFSISCWIKSDNVALAETNIITSVKSGSGFFAIKLETDKLAYTAVYSSGTTTVTSSVGSISNNVWYHCLATQSSTTGIKLYLNGILVDSNATTTNLRTTNNGQNRIGHYYSPTSGVFFDGSIDQIRIFNKALNSTEVTTLYNETACTKAACTGTTNTLDILGDGSCVAAYPLDGSPADLSGNYNGVQTNVTYPVGEFDLAGSFNGTSSFINLGTSTPLNSFNQNQTISLWIKPNGLQTISETLIGYRYDFSTLPWNYISSRTDNTIQFRIRNSSQGIFSAESTNTVNINQWNHICVTSSGSSVAIYINNVAETFTNTTVTSVVSSFPVSIGCNKAMPEGYDKEFFNGEIDQVRIFNKGLSAGEVTTLYNETPCN